MSSLSFGTLVERFEELRQAVATYAAKSAEKMRSEGMATGGVYVFVQTNRFRTDDPQYNNGIKIPLPYPTDSTNEIITAAVSGLEQIFVDGIRYNKTGVLLYDLIPAGEMQRSLFDPRDREELSRLMQALDAVNELYGPGTLRFGAEGFTKRWKLRQERLSDEGRRGRPLSPYQQTKRICELVTNMSLLRGM